MKNITIRQLAEYIGSEPPDEENTVISGVSIDSRSVKKGDVFFAIKGPNFDGGDFVAQAEKNGAVCAVIEKNISDNLSIPILKTPDTIEALGAMAKQIRDISGFKVIAITGSAGKTTTRNIIYHVLSGHFKCHNAQKSFNNNIGLPLTILTAPQQSQIVIAELGSNRPGEIEQLTKIAQPDIAVLTNIHPAHLEGFKTIEAIIAEKASIVKGLRAGGIFIINAINAATTGLQEYCRRHRLKFLTFGSNEHCDIYAENIKTEPFSGSFKIDSTNVTIPLAGRAGIDNAITAWAVCKNLGITAEQFACDIETVEPVDMRLRPVPAGKAVILEDCYNANPASMKNALDTLRTIGKTNSKRTVFICGKMAELGDSSVKYHRQLGKQIAQSKIDVLLTVKGEAGETVKAAQKYADYGIITEVFENTALLCNNLHKFLRPDDIILVKASRSEHFETVSRRIKEFYQNH